MNANRTRPAVAVSIPNWPVHKTGHHPGHHQISEKRSKEKLILSNGLRWLSAVLAVFFFAICGSQPVRAGGVTVITHGYESMYLGYPGWVDSMGNQIAAAAEAKGQTISRYHLVLGHTCTGGFNHTLQSTSSRLASEADEVVVTVDWAAWADTFDAAYGSHTNTTEIAGWVAYYLAAAFPDRGISSPLASRPLHLIGHSRGASVMMETARILGTSGIWVDHLTTLDPHPVTHSIKPDPAPHVYENVIFADNYWRDSGTVNGEALQGTDDWQLADELGHADVHALYHGTIGISGNYPASDAAPDGSISIEDTWYGTECPTRDLVGFHYSRIANGCKYIFSPDYFFAIGSQFGGRVTRETSRRSGAQWANVGKIVIPGQPNNRYPQGQPITATYKYQDRDSQVRIDWFVDSDTNPFNNSGALPVVSQTRNSTGDKAFDSSVTIPTAGLAVGITRHLLARITSLTDSAVRYEYADNSFSIIFPDFVLQSITPDSIESGAGVTRLTIHGGSFNQSEKVLFSNGTTTTAGVHDKFIPLSRVGGIACEPECVEAASSVETTHSHDGVGTFLGPEPVSYTHLTLPTKRIV